MSPVARRRLLVALVTALVVTGVVAFARWATPPAWLVGPHKVSMAVVDWTRAHLLAVIGVAVGAARLAIVLRERRERRGGVEQPPRDRDRAVMLRRVHNRWIVGVLDQSLTEEARIRLGLTRRPEIIAPSGMLRRRAGQSPQPLPDGTSLGEVFDKIGGGLLILGAPGSGKTTALLELARELLKKAEADQTQPIPVVFNLSSWTTRQPPVRFYHMANA